MKPLLGLAVLTAWLIGSVCHADEPVVGGPCEGCEYVFLDLPKELTSRTRIAAVDEPGEPMVIKGNVRTLDGKPAPGVIVYAYQTDADGVYPRSTTRHGSLRAWVRTDQDGNYWFDTIRPGAYPGRTIPQHVHMHIIEEDKATYYIADLVFDDDPLLTPAHRQRYRKGRGGESLGRPKKDAEGVWHVRREITLGQNIPEYPR